MLVLCQKLHICTYDRQKFSVDRPPFGDRPLPLSTAPPPRKKSAGAIEPPLSGLVFQCCCRIVGLHERGRHERRQEDIA